MSLYRKVHQPFLANVWAARESSSAEFVHSKYDNDSAPANPLVLDDRRRGPHPPPRHAGAARHRTGAAGSTGHDAIDCARARAAIKGNRTSLEQTGLIAGLTTPTLHTEAALPSIDRGPARHPG